jgi:hypothetical protein
MYIYKYLCSYSVLYSLPVDKRGRGDVLMRRKRGGKEKRMETIGQSMKETNKKFGTPGCYC